LTQRLEKGRAVPFELTQRRVPAYLRIHNYLIDPLKALDFGGQGLYGDILYG
jgi:hypothetical protein